VERGERARIAREREEVEDDAVRQLAGELDHARRERGGEDARRRRGARLVRSLRPRGAERADHRAHLPERVAHVDPERLVHDAVTDPEAEEQASAGELLHRRGLLGEERRLAEVDVRDRRADPEPVRPERHGLRVRERIAVRLGDEDRLVAERLGAPAPRDDVAGARIAERREREGDARRVHRDQ
jgi:hypothetical protein